MRHMISTYGAVFATMLAVDVLVPNRHQVISNYHAVNTDSSQHFINWNLSVKIAHINGFFLQPLDFKICNVFISLTMISGLCQKNITYIKKPSRCLNPVINMDYTNSPILMRKSIIFGYSRCTILLSFVTLLHLCFQYGFHQYAHICVGKYVSICFCDSVEIFVEFISPA